MILASTITDTGRSKIDEHSFSRAWSKSDSVERPVSTSSSQPLTFERTQGKYKSDGKFCLINQSLNLSLLSVFQQDLLYLFSGSVE